MITMTELRQLPTTTTTTPIITMYLPLSATDLTKLQLEFKQLVKEAQQMMTIVWPDQDWTPYATHFASAFATSRRIVDEPASSICIVNDGHGLQIFGLEISTSASVTVSERTQMLPLLLDAQQRHDFDVLTLQQDQIGFFHYDNHTLRAAALPDDAPRTLKGTLGSEIRGGNLNSVSQGPGKVSYHGHTDKAAEDANDTYRFFQQVDNYITTHYSHKSQRPLVLMGLAETLSVFRKLSSNPLLDEDEIVMSPSGMSLQELNQAATDLCKKVDTRNAQRTLALLATARDSKRISSELSTVRDWLNGGAIEQLVVSTSAYTPNRLIAGQDNPSALAEQNKLVNDIAQQVLLTGGTVHMLPADLASAPLTAIARYSQS